MLSTVSDWILTFSLIFGGCCSNAITLEQLTLQNPNAGSVITFFQFFVISLYGLPKFLIWTRYGPRLRPRRVPLLMYLAQVVLFYLVSYLNNVAFAYHIPMAVHIIFRSAGLIISMLLGWIISKKRYNTTQILSVLLVMIGVIVTTLSAQPTSKTTTTIDPSTYAKGIGILTLALIFSGFLGLLQDWTHPKPTLKSSQPIAHAVQQSDPGAPAAWQESMFYLHFLALPMFLSLLPDLAAQMHELNVSSQKAEVEIPIPKVSVNLTRTSIFTVPELPIHILPYQEGTHLLSIVRSQNEDTNSPISLSFSIPYVYLPLIVNTITQLLCVAGVHRLTTRVSAVTVTLVLVVRKAFSLIISVVGIVHLGRAFRDWIYFGLDSAIVFFGWDKEIKAEDWGFQMTGLERFLTTLGTALTGVGPAKKPQVVDKTMMWLGAMMVMLGTFGYTLGSRAKAATRKEKAE